MLIKSYNRCNKNNEFRRKPKGKIFGFEFKWQKKKNQKLPKAFTTRNDGLEEIIYTNLQYKANANHV
jgi:hypothetical protein